MSLNNEEMQIVFIAFAVSFVCAIFMICIFMIPFWCKAGTCSKCRLLATSWRISRRSQGVKKLSLRDLEEQALQQCEKKPLSGTDVTA
jgi:hypothetical protein